MPLIKKIQIAKSKRTVPAEIYPCEFGDVVQWQRQIHRPFIAPLKKIGHNWKWPALFLGCHTIEQLTSRQAIVFQIRVSDGKGNAVPVAQAILSLPYSWPGSPGKRCVFIWFVAAVPKSALSHFGVNQSFACLAPVVDTAIQVSFANGLKGRIGLHAALGATDEQSIELITRYTQLGLTKRPNFLRYFRFPFRKDDGRLFYLSERNARRFSKRHDHLR